MNQSLKVLNNMASGLAQAEFLKCCGSSRWATTMSDARPFEADDRLFAAADKAWWSLSPDDWLEAFRAHPKIGEKKAETQQSKQAESWSEQEQSGVNDTDSSIRQALARANEQYEQQFGFIFIICAAGKSAEEILNALNRRLNNDPQTELKIAAEEQRKITRLRLQKLLNQ